MEIGSGGKESKREVAGPGGPVSADTPRCPDVNPGALPYLR
jgi:hypothetical protein